MRITEIFFFSNLADWIGNNDFLVELIGLILVGSGIGAAIGCGKGRGLGGFVLGALLGPIGWLLVGVSKGNRAKCPKCRQMIDREAIICPFCRSNVAGFTFTVLLVLFLPSWAMGEDWTTVEGKTYKNVTVVSHDDGFVTILDEDGGAKIPLRLLQGNIQKRFGYDAKKAAAAEAANRASDQANMAALAAEQQRAKALRDAREQSEYSITEQQKAEQSNLANLRASAKPIACRITQVLPDGLICQKQHSEYQERYGAGGIDLGAFPVWVDDDLYLFLQIPSNGHAEGEALRVVAAPSGTYNYTDTSGASRTVAKWIYVGELEDTSSTSSSNTHHSMSELGSH